MFIPGEHVDRWAEVGRAQRTALEIADETTARELGLVGPDPGTSVGCEPAEEWGCS